MLRPSRGLSGVRPQVNFDCSCMWVRDAEPLKEALSLTPVYLRAKGNHLDFKARPMPLFEMKLVLDLRFSQLCLFSIQRPLLLRVSEPGHQATAFRLRP